MTDRRRRHKQNNSTSCASSTKFSSNFALFGCLGSIIAICILAIVCQIIDYTTNYDKHVVEKTYASEGLHIHRRLEEQVNKLLDRRIEQSNELFGSDSISTVDKLTHRRLEQVDDFGSSDNSMSCGDIFLNVKKNTTNNTTDTFYQQRLCNYANTCHGDYPSRTFLPLILCHNINTTNTTSIQYKLQTIYIYILLPPILLLYLLLLFRLLATTADSYFSPALESFSFELNLPPRFAGATLLALGNGSPDLGSTVNALLLWNDDDSSSSTSDKSITNGKSNLHGQGWQMSLGSLVGGGMFVGTVVCGLLIQSCNGIQCRVAFLRDVSMYALSVGIVWYTLESGTVTRTDVYLFLGIYLGYIVIILISDVYHRRVTLKRLHEEGREKRRSIKKRMSKLASQCEQENDENTRTERTSLMESIMLNGDYGGERSEQLKPSNKQGVRINDDIDYIDSEIEEDEEDKISASFDSSNSISSKYRRRPALNARDRLAMLMSNYDPLSVRRFDTSSSRASASSIGSLDDGTAELERITSLVRQAHPGFHNSFIQPSKSEEDGAEQQSYQQQQQVMFGSIDEQEEPELASPKWSAGLFKDAYDELVWRGRTFLTNSFQNEETNVGKIGLFLELPLIALRTGCIPVPCEDYYCRPIVALSVILSPYWVIWYTSADNIPAIVYCFICLIIGLSVLRYADDEKLPLCVGTLISLYGFSIAATWIDTIASNLVGLLQFLGTISRIPSSILGITILAWGNSMGDLSANLAMARKGMPDMATTGCFAGPSFNLLVGTGLGFLNLQYKLNRSSISPLALTRTIRYGFAFIIINCLLIVTIGVFFKWRQLSYKYSFVLFGIYSIFILTSLEPALHWL